MASCAAIRVNASNGSVKVWSNSFNQALAFVKSIEGRKFNSSDKSWSVPISIAQLSQAAGKSGCQVEDRNEDEDLQEMNRNFNPFKEGADGHKECAQAIDSNMSSLLKKLGINSGV